MNHLPSLVLGVVLSLFVHPAWTKAQLSPLQAGVSVPPVANQTPEVLPQPGATGFPAPASVVLPEGTAVKLKLLHTLNSKTVVADDPLNFTVAEDLLVDGKPVVKAGAVAIGRVRQAKRARTLGRGAELTLEMQYMRVGDLRVPLRGTQARKGEGKKGDVVALVVVFGLSGLVKHGSEIEVKEGSILSAYVDEDTKVQRDLEPSGAGEGR